jgi:hypothetical protein
LAPVADPALIRSLDTGQVAYIYRGGVTYIQIKRLIGSPPVLPPGTAPGPQAAELHPAAAALAHPATPRPASPTAADGHPGRTSKPTAAGPPGTGQPRTAGPDGTARAPITPPAWATRATGPVWPLPSARRPGPSAPPPQQPLSGPDEAPEHPAHRTAWPPAPEPPLAPATHCPPGLTAFLDAAFGPEPPARAARQQVSSGPQQAAGSDLAETGGAESGR